MQKFVFITAFPDAFPGVLAFSLVGKALQQGLWDFASVDLRQFGIGKHKKIDDRPFGGGAGMVLFADTVAMALDFACADLHNPRKIYVSARGRPFKQREAVRIAQEGRDVIILCGRFEGVDQRVLDLYQVDEFCIGDFVLSGGEIAAMALVDACVRLLPGVLGNNESTIQESFTFMHNGSCLIEYPQYTRPKVWRGLSVPDVLHTGDHALVKAWRLREALLSTQRVRPDMLNDMDSAKEE